MPAGGSRQEEAMDTDRFDGLAKEFAQVRSRRAVVQGLAGVAAGSLLALLGDRRAGSAGEKVLICHKTTSDTNAVVLIEVSANAVPDHLAHGDFVADNGSCEATCLVLGAACDPTKNECCEGLVCCPDGRCSSSADNCDGLD